MNNSCLRVPNLSDFVRFYGKNQTDQETREGGLSADASTAFGFRRGRPAWALPQCQPVGCGEAHRLPREMSIEQPQMIDCPSCGGRGEWESECCNGSGGCSCHGQPVNMGVCHVCRGSGQVSENISHERKMANLRSIQGACFLGSGPSTGIWANNGTRLNIV